MLCSIFVICTEHTEHAEHVCVYSLLNIPLWNIVFNLSYSPKVYYYFLFDSRIPIAIFTYVTYAINPCYICNCSLRIHTHTLDPWNHLREPTSQPCTLDLLSIRV